MSTDNFAEMLADFCFYQNRIGNIYLEFDDSFKGSCCFILDWLIFDAFVALCKWAGGAFDTVEPNDFERNRKEY